MDIKQRITDFIRRNRVSTTEVADCLGKSGVLENVMPINRGHFKVGNIKWVYAHAESNWDVHEQIVSTKENDVVFIEAFDCKHRAIIGELVCKYILLYHQASAIICNAKFRDAGALLRENYPIWCTGFTPVGCFNTKPEQSLDGLFHMVMQLLQQPPATVLLPQLLLPLTKMATPTKTAFARSAAFPKKMRNSFPSAMTTATTLQAKRLRSLMRASRLRTRSVTVLPKVRSTMLLLHLMAIN